jgi:hypothetical protein
MTMSAAPASIIPLPITQAKSGQSQAEHESLHDSANHQFVEPLPGPMTPPTMAEMFTNEEVEIAMSELRRVIGPRSGNAMGILRLAARANIKPALMKVAVMHLHFYAEVRRRYSSDGKSCVYFAAYRLGPAGPPQTIPERLQMFPMPRPDRWK